MNARLIRLVLFAIPAALLAACGTTPSTITQGPNTARPVAPLAQTASNGTIYQAASHKPLFEDRRARHVGDILTIAINERTQAGKQASSSGSKTGSADASISALLGLSATTLNRATASAASSNEYEDAAALNSSNSFTGNLSVTVIDVLPNGNLVVAGEKQIGFDKGIEYVRLSGVVQPDTILAGNTVPSAKVADARIEYRTSAKLDTAEVMGWLARFFLSVAPL